MKSFILNFFSRYYLFFIFFFFCLAFQGIDLRSEFRFDREQIDTYSEYWRLLSSNFIHLGWPHFWMNMGAFGLMWLMFATRLTTREWLGVIFISSLFLSSLLWLYSPELQRFVGFSGTLHGIMLAGCWREYRFDRFIAIAAGGLTILKLGWEQIYGAFPGSAESAGGPVLVDSHLYGAIGGLLCVIAFDLFKKSQEKCLNSEQSD